MKIGMHIIFCVHAVWLKGHPCLKEHLRETWAWIFSLLVLQVLPIHLQGLNVQYDTLTCILHVYRPSVRPVADYSLFLDIQVVTLLSGEYTLFAWVNLYYLTTRLPRSFQQYSQHTYLHDFRLFKISWKTCQIRSRVALSCIGKLDFKYA